MSSAARPTDRKPCGTLVRRLEPAGRERNRSRGTVPCSEKDCPRRYHLNGCFAAGWGGCQPKKSLPVETDLPQMANNLPVATTVAANDKP